MINIIVAIVTIIAAGFCCSGLSALRSANG